MAQKETYSNWLGPPKGLQRQGGIYSVAGTVTPAGTFRPASPESFEDDYDDVSLSELAGGHKLPATDDGRQSQGCEGSAGSTGLLAHQSAASAGNELSLEGPQKQPLGPPPFAPTDLYTMVGKPASPPPAQTGAAEPRGGRGCCGLATLYVLVALSFVAWGLLFALAVVKYMGIVAELELLRCNRSEHQASAPQELREPRRGTRGCAGELREVAGRGCRGCAAGWRLFESSCYCFSDDTLSWADAARVCAGHGGHLVIVDSEEEQSFLRDSIGAGSSYWLGASDQREEGTWVWADGNRVTLSYWRVREANPRREGRDREGRDRDREGRDRDREGRDRDREGRDREERDCGSIGPDGVWSDAGCHLRKRWVCERAPGC